MREGLTFQWQGSRYKKGGQIHLDCFSSASVLYLLASLARKVILYQIFNSSRTMGGRRRSSVVEITRSDDGVLRVDDGAIRRMSVANPDIPQINQEAKNATSNELNMTVREALRLYPKAVLFSVIFSTAVVMEGYDLSLMGSFYAFTPFKNFFGDQPDPEEGGRLVSAQWQTGVSNGVQACSSL